MSGYQVMPFGKHRGHYLRDIPGGYLFWVIEECEQCNPELRVAIRQELARRILPRTYSPQRTVVDREKVLDWCRRAALACHPDHGGNTKAMKLVNELRDMFR